MNENKNEINKNNTTEESFENQSPKDIESDSINYNFTNNGAGDDSKEKSTKKAAEGTVCRGRDDSAVLPEES